MVYLNMLASGVCGGLSVWMLSIGAVGPGAIWAGLCIFNALFVLIYPKD